MDNEYLHDVIAQLNGNLSGQGRPDLKKLDFRPLGDALGVAWTPDERTYRERVRDALVGLVERYLRGRITKPEWEVWQRHVVEGRTGEGIVREREAEPDYGSNRLLKTQDGIRKAYRVGIAPVVVEIVQTLLVEPDATELGAAFEEGRAGWSELGRPSGRIRKFHGMWIQEFHDHVWFDAVLVFNRWYKQVIPVRNGFGGAFLHGSNVAAALGPPLGPEFSVTKRAWSYGLPGVKPHTRQTFAKGGLAWDPVNTRGEVVLSRSDGDFAIHTPGK